MNGGGRRYCLTESEGVMPGSSPITKGMCPSRILSKVRDLTIRTGNKLKGIARQYIDP